MCEIYNINCTELNKLFESQRILSKYVESLQIAVRIHIKNR